jgi:hypothetical protein
VALAIRSALPARSPGLRGGDEDLAPAHPRQQPGDERVPGAVQPHDDVGQPAESLAGLVFQRPAEQGGEVDVTVVRFPCAGGWSCRCHGERGARVPSHGWRDAATSSA